MPCTADCRQALQVVPDCLPNRYYVAVEHCGREYHSDKVVLVWREVASVLQ